MFHRIPSIGTPISSGSLLRGLGGRDLESRFSRMLRDMTGRKFCALTGSGSAALFLILRALRKLAPEERTEVLMPAYTAPSLVLVVREAGTVPLLSEVSTSTFNQDHATMCGLVGERTLAVMPVHMYGLIEDLSGFETHSRSRGAFVIEDAASAQGSVAGGRPAGSMGDVSFLSFNRGKNLSTVAGGAVLTDREDIFEAVEEEALRLASPDGAMRVHLLVKAVGLSLIWRPALYSLLRPIAEGYRYRSLHERIELLSYTQFQAGIGCSLMERKESIFSKRRENGLFLHESLQGSEHLTLPRLLPGSSPAFNQFPLLTDPRSRNAMLRELDEAGLEATTLYPLPLHRIYELGYAEEPDPFPGASRMASGLLLLPVHPGVEKSALSKAARIVRDGRWIRSSSTDRIEKHTTTVL